MSNDERAEGPRNAQALIAAADALYRTTFGQLAPHFILRRARKEDDGVLLQLFAACQLEAIRRLDPAGSLPQQMIEMQFDLLRNAYAAAHPHAHDYLCSHKSSQEPVGRIMLDWSGTEAAAGIDLAIFPAQRSGAAGLLLLRAWTQCCDLLARPARLHVLPDNPARKLYRRLGFVELNNHDFPLPMIRYPLPLQQS